MKFFECCRVCPKTKRHVGCHSDCKDYLKDKEKFETLKIAIRRQQEKEFQELPVKIKLSKYRR